MNPMVLKVGGYVAHDQWMTLVDFGIKGQGHSALEPENHFLVFGDDFFYCDQCHLLSFLCRRREETKCVNRKLQPMAWLWLHGKTAATSSGK